MNGRSRLQINEVIAKISKAKVATLVAFSQAISISASERSGFEAKYGLRCSWPI